MPDKVSGTKSGASSPLAIAGAATAELATTMRRSLGTWLTRLGVTGREQSDILLGTAEGLGNVVRHAYWDTATPGPMAIEAHEVSGGIVITIQDEGTWKPALEKSARRGAIEVGGWGLQLMKSLTEKLVVDRGRADRGTTVVAHYKLA
jgi:anti-sigma regulatory factor (Ser/Thr protein kinase)